jgi:hypothetical protein
MNSNVTRVVSSGVLALLLMVATGLVQAGSKPLPSSTNAYGKGYAELTADWLEWVLAIPAATNPILDSDGADSAAGQSGKVWFLAGTTGGPATRSVTVPVGKALFFPIVNFFWVNTPEFGDPPWSDTQEAFVRDFLAFFVDSAQDLVLEIDGQSYPHVERLRISGDVGSCTLPDDNIFGLDFAPGPHECVADGYWALLPPLSAGVHTIRFAGALPAVPFSLDVTYHLTVAPR